LNYDQRPTVVFLYFETVVE